MAMPSDTWPVNRKLAKDQRDALGMLAACLRGRTESVMEAHGVAIGTLRGLVRAGLATADRGPAYFNPGAIVTHYAADHRGEAKGDRAVTALLAS
jgi:hypothetical protein